MSGLETAIRHALERSDRTNAETRARIYQSARNALEAGLKKQDVHDQNVVAQQRHRLEAIIHAIEIEERAALKAAAAASVPPPVQLDAGASHPAPPLDGDLDVAPERDPADAAGPVSDGGLAGLRPERRDRVPASEGASVEPVSRKARRDARTSIVPPKPRRSRRGRLLSLLMVATTLVAALGTAAWWAQTSGLLMTDAERDTSVANPPSTVQSEDFDGTQGPKTLGNQSGFSGDWIDVFNPAQSASVTAGSRAAADPVSDESGQHLRITSATADADGNVRIEIPVAVLEQISGKTSTIALAVQSATGKPTQFAVECDFASLGECGRHRFTVADEKSDMLFQLTFDRSLVPSSPGHILLNSDITGAGQSLNLFAVRILPGQ